MIVFIPSVSSYLTLFNGIHGASLVAQLRILIGTNSQLENETKKYLRFKERERGDWYSSSCYRIQGSNLRDFIHKISWH